MLSRFVWFGLVSGPAPKFRPVLRRDELPPDVLDLEGFSEILSNYYTEQKIGQLCTAKCSRSMSGKSSDCMTRLPISCLNPRPILRAVVDPAKPQTFTIIVEPLVGRITNVRNFVDHYAIILSGNEEIPTDVVRHAVSTFFAGWSSVAVPARHCGKASAIRDCCESPAAWSPN